MNIPESFTVDHTCMEAPTVRRASCYTGPKGDEVTKYDIRFLKPNSGAIPTGGMHSLEHFLATFMCDHLEGIIDISPMGCRTGFYLVCFGRPDEDDIREAVLKSLERITSDEVEVVPGAKEEACGNWRDHSLFTAREYARQVIREWQR